MHTKNTLKVRLSFIVALIYTLSILILSLIDLHDIKIIELESSDKVYHTFSYTLMVLFWMVHYKLKFKTINFKHFFVLILSVIVFGIIIEYLQLFLTSYRSFDWWDVLSNTIGVIIGFILFMVAEKLFNTEKI